MFIPGQTVYVKVSQGYVKCTVLNRKGTYYTVKSNGTGFGCSENRIISEEQYEKWIKEHPVIPNIRPPNLH